MSSLPAAGYGLMGLGQQGGGNQSADSGWNMNCEGTARNPYRMGCMAANIGYAQSCLGTLYKGIVDDKFGNLTLQAVRQKLKKDTFTIDDLNDRICPTEFADNDNSEVDNQNGV